MLSPKQFAKDYFATPGGRSEKRTREQSLSGPSVPLTISPSHHHHQHTSTNATYNNNNNNVSNGNGNGHGNANNPHAPKTVPSRKIYEFFERPAGFHPKPDDDESQVRKNETFSLQYLHRSF